jgi:hypothetical protein
MLPSRHCECVKKNSARDQANHRPSYNELRFSIVQDPEHQREHRTLLHVWLGDIFYKQCYWHFFSYCIRIGGR